MAQPDLILVPFAANAPAANVDAIPVTLGPSDPPQAASWSQGFPQVTMTPLAAGGIPPRGQSFNGVLQDITEHLVFIGGGGQYLFSPAFVTEKGGYAVGAVLQSNDGKTSYRSAVNLNTKNFNTDPTSIGVEWIPYAGEGVLLPLATELVSGVAKIATQGQSNAGTDDATIVSPRKRAVSAQLQSGVAFNATSPSSGLHDVAPSPAITAYAVNQRFQVTFSANSTGVDLIRVSGLAYRGLKQYDSSGTKSVAIFSTGQKGDIVYDGTDFVLLGQPVPFTVTSPQLQAQTYTAFAAVSSGAALYSISPSPAIIAYATNQRFLTVFPSDSTGTDLVRVSALAYKSIKQYNSSGVKEPAVFKAGQNADINYDGTDFVLLNRLPPTVSVAPPPSGFLSGFLLANNATTPNTNIDVGSGFAADTTGAFSLSLGSTMVGILQSSGAWAAGTGANKLDTGGRALSTWYHVFVIRKTSDGASDILFSLSPTAPTMPSGYAGFRRVGSVRTSSGGPIILFYMKVLPSGRRIVNWTTPIMDANAAPLGTSSTNYILSVPSGLATIARINTFSYANNSMVYFYDPVTATLVPANSATYSGFTCGYGVVTESANEGLGSQLEIITNNSSQISAIANAAGNTVSILTLGWEE